MFSIKKEFEISYAHRLLNYNGKCENLHGHNAKIEIVIQSRKLNKQEMVEDFNYVKKVVKEWLDENLDHATLLHYKDPLVKALQTHKQKIFLFKKNPTAEIIAYEIAKNIEKLGLKIKTVRFWETSTSMAQYTKE